jgi:choline dehydrogenase-like flavoprotein
MQMQCRQFCFRVGDMTWDYLIVGAGFAGAVLAERLASQRGATCLVIDKRAHIAGNAYDRYDAAGVLIHTYGPHYFRTNSDRIVTYLSQFTEWHHVDYKILSWTDGRYWQFPINLNTFEQLLGRPSTSEEMERTLAEWRVPIESPKNSEEVIISQVGRRLYEMFFRTIRANSGSAILPNSTRASAVASRCGRTVTTATCLKNFRRCRRTATRRCSGGCSHIQKSRCG